MISVITNTTGQSNTPQVRLKEYESPNNRILAGFHPNNSSNEKIFTPINSATIAFAIKKPDKMMNSLVDLSFRILCIMFRKYEYSLVKEKLPGKIKIKH